MEIGCSEGEAMHVPVFVSKCVCATTGGFRIIEGTTPPAGVACGVCGRAKEPGSGKKCEFKIELLGRCVKTAFA